MQTKIVKKAIAVAVAMAISGSSYATLPKGEDFKPGKMPLRTYLAKSVASEADLEKIAAKYFDDYSTTNPFDIVDSQRLKLMVDQFSQRVMRGDYSGAATKIDSSETAHRMNRFDQKEAAKISDKKLEYILGVEPPFGQDFWLASYMTRYLAATHVGGRVIKTWPEKTKPLYGSLAVQEREGEIDWHLNSESPEYAEYQKRIRDGVTGSVDISKFPRLVARYGKSEIGGGVSGDREVEGEAELARRFMRNTVIAIYVTQMIAYQFYTEEEREQYQIKDLFMPIGGPDIGWSSGEIRLPLPRDAAYNAQYAQNAIWRLAGTPETFEVLRNGLASIVKSADRTAYVALSKKGEPVKFMFKRADRRKLRWTLVEFTDKGIVTRTIRSERSDFPIYAKTWSPALPPQYTCDGGFVLQCSDFLFGHFSDKKLLGMYQVAMIPNELKSKSEVLVDALESGSMNMAETSRQQALPQLPKAGEMVDFWELSKQVD